MAQATDPKRTGSIQRVVGLLMAGLVLLAVTGMVSSMVIAHINQGMATAVNQSGTLRMQSYRIGVALADDRLSPDERRRQVARLTAEFDARLRSPRLTHALPGAADDPVQLAYERVRWRWAHEMRRALDAFVVSPTGRQDAQMALASYLDGVDDFVDDIHGLVRVLEERAEQRIDLLRLIQTVALVLTVGIVLVTMVILQRRVVTPLGELLRCADRARQGDFSRRTRFAGTDELGRLGAAMNLMTEGLYEIYNELEERVAAKTRDLARTNHSLELLYRTSRMINESPVSEPVLRRVLGDVRSELRLADVVLCLRDGDALTAGECIAAGAEAEDRGRGDRTRGCEDASCRLCAAPLPLTDDDAARAQEQATATTDGPAPRFSTGPALIRAERPAGGPWPGVRDQVGPDRANGSAPPSTGADAGGTIVPATETHPDQAGVLSFPVADQHRCFGTLRVLPRPGRRLAAWQQPLLEAVAGQMATALNLQSRMRESRRLMLHEERSILARELHDSLAQSLSYLKIQAARLDVALRDAPRQSGADDDLSAGPGRRDDYEGARPTEILAELRTGISSAYRQLRELLTTFRLKMDGRGLADALADTAQEFRDRSHLDITLDDRLPIGLLSPNEEVHVLQITREALSNVVRHARAKRCRVGLTALADRVEIIIADDGVGLRSERRGHGHYGMTIMRERAASLGGWLEIDSPPSGGFRVRVGFSPRGIGQGVDDPPETGAATAHHRRPDLEDA